MRITDLSMFAACCFFPGPVGHDAAAVALLLEDPDREVDRRMGQLQGPTAELQQLQQQQHEQNGQQQEQDGFHGHGHGQLLLTPDPHRLSHSLDPRLTHGSALTMATSLALPQLSPQELDRLLPMATYSSNAAAGTAGAAAAEGAAGAGLGLEAAAERDGAVCSSAQRGDEALVVDADTSANGVSVSTLAEADARAAAPACAAASPAATPAPPALLLPPVFTAATPSPPSVTPSATSTTAPPAHPSLPSAPAAIPLSPPAESPCAALAQEQGVSPAPAPGPGPAAVVGGTPECAVCSEVFQEGEPVALLPCQHFFHNRWGAQLLPGKPCPWLAAWVARWLVGMYSGQPAYTVSRRKQEHAGKAAHCVSTAYACLPC